LKIVIVGSGNVGYHLAALLVEEGHDIVVIDNHNETLEKLVEVLDIKGVHGNGSYLDVQMEADVPHADLVIAVAQRDEINMLCCLLAKKLGAKHTIARVRNLEYSRQLHLLSDELGLSMAINPELAAASEIARILKFPSALKIDTLAKGLVELVHFKLAKDNPLVENSLQEISGKFSHKILISAVERNGEVDMPTGSYVLQAGDKVHIVGKLEDITKFFKSLGLFIPKSKYVMIVGGGQIAFYLAQQILTMGMKVKIIENDRKRCMELCEFLPTATIINSDGTDQDVLMEEKLEGADSFIALTESDEANLIISMFAKSKGVAKVITKINRSKYMNVMQQMEIDSFISQQLITSNTIARYVRAMQNTEGSSVETLYKFVDDKAEAIEFIATGNTRHIYEHLKDLKLKKNLLIAALVRKNNVIIPDGNDKIIPGDNVIVVTTNKKLNDLDDIFAVRANKAAAKTKD
jgi:trk system potassium uptake protein